MDNSKNINMEIDDINNIVSLTFKVLQDKTKLIKANKNLEINCYGLKSFLQANGQN